jgi:mRNA-degrading endonuclease toxin of MazEF toxin-antitoxin module
VAGVVCVVTNTEQRYPYSSDHPGSSLTGFVMVEQVKFVDYAMRRGSLDAPRMNFSRTFSA